MRYAFAPGVYPIGSRPVDVPKDRYDEVLTARRNLYVALYTEEKASIVLANFQEFEREILDQTLTFMLHPKERTWSEFVETIQCMNRRIINFTSTCRLYIDQVKHDVSTIHGADSAPRSDLDNAISYQYDSNLAYRAMEEIRNYAQHRSLPITGLHSSASATQPKVGAGIRHLISPKIDTKALRDGGSFKKKILDELEQLGAETDIKYLVRSYMDSFAAIHRKVRKLLKEKVAEAESKLECERVTLELQSKTPVSAWNAIESDDNGSMKSQFLIWDEFSKRRKLLELNNTFENQFLKSFVTAEIDRPKDED